MTPLEIIAFVLIIVGIVKILVLAFNPKSWMNFAKGIWKTSALGIIYFVLAALVFYYLIQELTIIQILAVTAFVALLIGLQFARYSKETMTFVQKMIRNKKDVWSKNWLYILIWLILMLWGLKELFM
ncbi:MAG: hypothetical protein KKF48_01390 [Nanoarchaeota archaeon]|nr:hypothetical protein [Nanoarchaeota archaeon]MBU1027676.1 hypothetical protein [Nanoarchaeota archaeon]